MKQNLTIVLILVILLPNIQSSVYLSACDSYCYLASGCDFYDPSLCSQAHENLYNSIYTFQYSKCVDFLISLNEEEGHIITNGHFVECIEEFNQKNTSVQFDQREYLSCYQGCFEDVSDDVGFDKDLLPELQTGQICLAECFQSSEECQYESECIEEYDVYEQMYLVVKYQIQSCDELYFESNFKSQYDNEELNQLYSRCLADQSFYIQKEEDEKYPDELSDVISCLSGCYNEYGIDFSEISENSNQEESEEDYSEEEDQDCDNNTSTCYKEIEQCEFQCQIQCEYYYCSDDNEYISMIMEDDCQDYLLAYIELQEKNRYQNDIKFFQYKDQCYSTLQRKNENNNDFYQYSQCLIENCSSNLKYEDDGEYGQLLIPQILALVFLVLLI